MDLFGRNIGIDSQIFFIAGPCVIENYDIAMKTGEVLADLALKYNVLIVYKSSFIKANRTSAFSYRGPGLDRGLEILQRVKRSFNLMICADVHCIDHVVSSLEVVDLLQIPSLLVKQTDLIECAAESSKPIHFKKGQYQSPEEMKFVIEKARHAASVKKLSIDRFIIGERGTTFGYDNLVVDMRSLEVLKEIGCPVVFDATHSTHQMGSAQRRFTPLLARAAVAAGVSGIFIETHPNPNKALCDGDKQWPLGQLDDLLSQLIEIDDIIKSNMMTKRWS